METENRDRWLIDGNCTKCRRQKFCSKPCKRHKGAVQRELMGMMTSAMIKVMIGGTNRKGDD